MSAVDGGRGVETGSTQGSVFYQLEKFGASALDRSPVLFMALSGIVRAPFY